MLVYRSENIRIGGWGFRKFLTSFRRTSCHPQQSAHFLRQEISFSQPQVQDHTQVAHTLEPAHH